MIEGLLTLMPGAMLAGHIYVKKITADKFARCECQHLVGDVIGCPITQRAEVLAPKRGLHWEKLLADNDICNKLCLHNPHCFAIASIPEFINPPEFASWSFDASSMVFRHPDGVRIVSGAQIKNPKFKAVAFGTRKAASSSTKWKAPRKTDKAA